MNALAHSYLFWIALIMGLLALYILPSVIAAIRGVQGLGWIILINLLPTGVGWLAAFIAAVALPRGKHPATQPSHCPTARPISHPPADGRPLS
jgi:hypothetical protein